MKRLDLHSDPGRVERDILASEVNPSKSSFVIKAAQTVHYSFTFRYCVDETKEPEDASRQLEQMVGRKTQVVVELRLSFY
jgi:hypothetical protein